MVLRFEVVPPPVEDRLKLGIQEQAIAALSTAKDAFNAVEVQRSEMWNDTVALLNDDVFVRRMGETCASLLMPRSLPGFLLLFAALLRVTHYVALRFVASRAVSSHQVVVNDVKED